MPFWLWVPSLNQLRPNHLERPETQKDHPDFEMRKDGELPDREWELGVSDGCPGAQARRAPRESEAGVRPVDAGQAPLALSPVTPGSRCTPVSARFGIPALTRVRWRQGRDLSRRWRVVRRPRTARLVETYFARISCD